MTGATAHFDVIIIGAGISGIGAAHHLKEDSPRRSFAVLEARDSLGGTWDLFRYPGVRSDSDLYTFGYSFRPWRDEQSIASADRILQYLRETVRDDGTEAKIRFGHRVVTADWSSSTQRWQLEVERTDTGERVRFTAGWLFCAGGYYRYDRGYTPEIHGLDRFEGPVVHPQHWPDDLDVTGKRVAVIGSGATAVTIVPAISDTAASVTMVQRTPTYILPIASRDRLAKWLRPLLGDRRTHRIVRAKNIALQRVTWRLARRFPEQARRIIRRANISALPAGFPVDEHFNPPYNPWDQRLCFVPDGDFFDAIRAGKANIITDQIREITERGIEFESGRRLEADVLVTATGLDVQPFGSVRLSIDGTPLDLSEHLSYRGLMLDGVPNLAYAIGYTNASWTLKIGLVCEYFTRLLARMDGEGYAVCWAERPHGKIETRPLLDFGAGYVSRAIDRLPKQGPKPPWLTSLDYSDDIRLLRKTPVIDEYLRFK